MRNPNNNMLREILMKQITCLLFFVATMICYIPASAKYSLICHNKDAPPLGLTKWLPMTGVPGGEIMMLIGNPGKNEHFVARVRRKAGSSPVIGPHFHTTTYNITVLHGTFVIGFGDKVDLSKVQEYGPGSFLEIKKGVHHFEWFCGDVETQIEGIGPLETVFLNRSDDPRLKMNKTKN